MNIFPLCLLSILFFFFPFPIVLPSLPPILFIGPRPCPCSLSFSLASSPWPSKAEVWLARSLGLFSATELPLPVESVHLIPWQEEKLPQRNQTMIPCPQSGACPRSTRPHKGSRVGRGGAALADICLTHFFLSHSLSTHHPPPPPEFSGLILVVKSHTFSQSLCKPGRIDS